MRIGVIGSGTVGEVLAEGFLKYGHEVMRGSRTPEKLSDWAARHGERASVGTFAVTAVYGDVVVLAVKGSAAHPFYRWAGQALGAANAPRWNFHKYLVGSHGRLIAAYGSAVEPLSTELTRAVEAALAAPAMRPAAKN